jgi:hypothetical protein
VCVRVAIVQALSDVQQRKRYPVAAQKADQIIYGMMLQPENSDVEPFRGYIFYFALALCMTSLRFTPASTPIPANTTPTPTHCPVVR